MNFENKIFYIISDLSFSFPFPPTQALVAHRHVAREEGVAEGGRRCPLNTEAKADGEGTKGVGFFLKKEKEGEKKKNKSLFPRKR